MNRKALTEKLDQLTAQMSAILSKAETENRTFSDEERTQYEGLEAEAKNVKATIKAIDDRNAQQELRTDETQQAAEERAFANALRGIVENRTGEVNVGRSGNTAIIPVTISDRIVAAIKERSPILERATVFNIPGTLKIPVYGPSSGHDVAVAYGTEFSQVTADAGAFTAVTLNGYIIDALSLIGDDLINNAAFDVVSYFVNLLADDMVYFLEGEALKGTGDTYSHATGALTSSNTVTAGNATKILSDELIDLQSKVKSRYQVNACWIMAPATFAAVRKLKDDNKQYLLTPGIAEGAAPTLLGKPVFLSDNMPTIAASAKTVLYGDLSCMAVKFSAGVSVTILKEKYADQNAVGVIAKCNFDCKPMDTQGLAVLVMAAADPT